MHLHAHGPLPGQNPHLLWLLLVQEEAHIDRSGVVVDTQKQAGRVLCHAEDPAKDGQLQVRIWKDRAMYRIPILRVLLLL